MKLPRLYKRTTTGAVQVWDMVIDGNSYYSIEGIKDGKMTQNKPTFAVAMNVGRANATTPEQQAEKEARAKHKKKLEQGGYTERLEDIDNDSKFFKPQLAEKYLEHKDKVKFPALVSRKIDGLRMIIQQSGITTRLGKAFSATPHLRRILDPLFIAHPSWVIDGEAYTSKVPFEQVVSLTKRSKPTKEDLEASEKLIQLWVFDGITDNKQASFSERFPIICAEINRLVKSDSIVIVNNELADSHEDIKRRHDKYVAEGMEGLMIRDPDSPYLNRRTTALLKFKEFDDDEFTIVDIEEAKGNRAGMAGTIHVRLKNGGICGAGIAGGEDYYKELWKRRKQLIGKSCTVRYQGFTDAGSLRFPVVKNVAPIDR